MAPRTSGPHGDHDRGDHHDGYGFPPNFGPGHFGQGFAFGGFGGGRGRGPRARKGEVRGAILSLLAEGPHSGYSLIKGIAEKTGGVWRPSPGSVYPTLQLLLDEGLITTTATTGTRSDYRLTDEGRAYVDSHADELASAFGAAEQTWDEHGELFASIGKLAVVIRQLAAEGNADQRAKAVSQIDELRRSLYLILAD